MAHGAANGTPRGFRLHMPAFGNSGPIPGGFPPNGMSGFVGPPDGWNPSVAVGGDIHGLHHPGVMRRGQNRHNNRPGPYDRRRNNNNGGRLSPVRMAPYGRLPPGVMSVPPGHPAAGMAPQFPDAGAGSQAMAPREAVQGRQLRSYEDLDAVGGADGGELNY